jgi:hypothetical protein
VDIVFKDGYVHAVRGGVVTDLLPWDGNNPWGWRVVIKDDTGLTWQYAHLGDRRNPTKNPFGVTIGEEVSAGDAIGIQGNTGRVLSKKSPSDPTYGVHCDIRIVQYEKAMKQFDPTNYVRTLADTLSGGTMGKYIPQLPSAQVSASIDGLVEKYERTSGKLITKDQRAYLEKYGDEGLKSMLGDKYQTSSYQGTNQSSYQTQAIPENY